MSPPHSPLAGWLALYSEFMQSFAHRFGNRGDAEDAAHDAIEQLLSRGDVTTIEHARRFLFRAAAHRRIDASTPGAAMPAIPTSPGRTCPSSVYYQQVGTLNGNNVYGTPRNAMLTLRGTF